MGEFAAAVLAFPAVVFTFALVVVVVFWVTVSVGALDHDALDGHVHADALGMGGVPVTVGVSLLTAVAWLVSVVGGVLLLRLDLPSAAHSAAATGVLVVAVLVAWRATRSAVRPLRHLFPDEPGPSRADFIGLTCTVRTGRVSERFGQAEVAAPDGSTAVVQVRQTGADAFVSGSTALLCAYDEDGEFFWITPFDAALDPRG